MVSVAVGASRADHRAAPVASSSPAPSDDDVCSSASERSRCDARVINGVASPPAAASVDRTSGASWHGSPTKTTRSLRVIGIHALG
jgi:hypothetical protein